MMVDKAIQLIKKSMETNNETTDMNLCTEENTLIAPDRDTKGISYVQLSFRIPMEDKQHWNTIAKWMEPLSGNKGFPLLMKAIVAGINEGWADKLIKPEIYK